MRVKDGSKRKREPKILSAEEFRQMLEHIPEPFRTMCIVAMCMGLRVSEVLGLKWCDIDWEGMRVGIRQSYVYGITRRCKSTGFPTMDAVRPFSGGRVASAPIEVCFARGPRRLDLCKPGYRKTVLSRMHPGELACSRRGKGGD